MADQARQDSLEKLPASSGFQRAGAPQFTQEQKRKQYRYVAAIAQIVLDRHPRINEANNATARLTAELTALRKEVGKLQSTVEDLTTVVEEQQEEIRQLTEAQKEARRWEQDIYEHIASVDAKALGMAELSDDMAMLVELLNLVVPPLEWLSRGASRWADTLRRLKGKRLSSVDGENISDLIN